MLRRAVLLSAAILAASASLARAGNQDFRLVNNSGRQVDGVFVSRVTTDNWEEDVLGRNTLPMGRAVNIRFNGNSSACNWDMLVKYHGGGQDAWRNLNLCNIRTITLYRDNRGEVQARSAR